MMTEAIRVSLSAVEQGSFQPKVRFSVDAGNFSIKTVETPGELEEALELRHEVFYREYQNSELPWGLDIDDYDLMCDHLVIRDVQEKRLVGTYRLICSSFSNRFYSQSEFNLDGFLESPGVKLELGRACVDRSYRSGIVMTLLWRGLAQYIRLVKADYLFGCSSVKTISPAEVAKVSTYLKSRGHFSDEFGIHPLPNFRMPKELEMEVEGDAKDWIPSLLNSYLKAGAQVHGEPALDRAFGCVDFFTILRTAQLSQVFERRFSVS
jgi:putative hemolysin